MTPLDQELFWDGLTTYWVTTMDGLRSANEAVEIAAKHDGPFKDSIEVKLVAGHVDDCGPIEGLRFTPDHDGDVECWEVEAQ